MSNDVVDPVFRAYPTAKWEVGGKTWTFAVEQLAEGRSNRLAKHRRLYRDGARIDGTGANERTWEISTSFFNDGDQEGGIDGAAQYPDNVNGICDSFDTHETGTLTLPTRGPRRCCAESYSRTEKSGERDAAECRFLWVEDSEDDDAVAAYQEPSAKTLVRPASDEAVAACEAAGVVSEDLASLADLANDLVAMAEFPGEFVADMDAKGRALVARAEAVEQAFAQAGTEGVNEAVTLLADPGSSLAGRRLRELGDTAARVAGDVAGGGVRVVGRTFSTTLSIFDIATELGQRAPELMTLNSSLPDLYEIPAGTVVRVFDDA